VANSYPNLPTSTYPVRLPSLGNDDSTWGAILNNYLTSSLTDSGFLSKVSVQTGSVNPYLMNLFPGETVLANASGGSFNVTLPDATQTTNFYTVKKTDSSSNTITVNTTSSQTIDGGSSAVISVQYVSVTVVSNGANWFVV
jgi:hypothetical protein